MESMEKKTDLRIIKTHKALCDTFLEMLEKKKFENITVNELCENAMVRRATFYKHFADKYDFFGFFIRQIQEQFLENLKEYEHDTCASYCSYLTHQLLIFLDQHERLVNSVTESNVFPTLLSILTDEIYRHILLMQKENIVSGKPLPVTPEFLASFYSGGIVQVLRGWITGKKVLSEEELVKQFDTIFCTLQPE